ncbi:DMT family transporter [Roseobacter sp. N2S]|uniref:DMT family transporter n=1 Tax=Roseobacter sp. N2S TaxID=2663844 RepID=UPI0028612528|nr:DMT family transporter [Roseobacter sp. N2S]MDR6265146.1 drug/metabolite transporter (DMT)-like permease [Roseobacter sp. N2S]
MTQDRPLLGIAFMTGFCILAPLGDSIAKILGDSIPLVQLLLVRFVAQVVLLWPIIWFTGLPVKMPRRLFWLMVLRTMLHIIGIGAMFTSLRYLPLADAVAIAFVMPFIMLLLGKFVLNEEVGPHRLMACLVGFIGTLLVIQPSFAAVGWPALLPLVVAVDFALFMLVTRKVAKEVDAMNLQAQSGVIATVLIGVVWLVLGPFGGEVLQAVSPTPYEWGLLAAIGILGTLAHLLMTWSLRFAPSATLAPMQYLEIPVATVIGFLIFKDLPNGLASLGISITIGAGLYVIFREQYLSRKVA